MSPLLPSTLTNSRNRQPFLLLQSSSAQSCVPVIRHLVRQTVSSAPGTTLLFCLLYPPEAFVNAEQTNSGNIHIFNWTDKVPGYDDDQKDTSEDLLKAVRSAPLGPLTVVIDSVDTLFSDLGSLAKTEKLLTELLSLVRSREDTSRLVLHVIAPSPLIPILVQTRFSPTLSHVTAHPTALLKHLATEYLTLPPPLSPPEKFWGVFLPIVDRHYESEKLIFGSGGEGSGGVEFVVEVLVRGADGSGRKRGVERVLEGWSCDGLPCELTALESLKSLWKGKAVEESGPDPTQNLSFNLNLTPEQQQSRAQVPLPYAHEGKPTERVGLPPPAAILYDPDSADDLDDDDPDEDLDI